MKSKLKRLIDEIERQPPRPVRSGWYCTGCFQQVALSEHAAASPSGDTPSDLVSMMTTPGYGKRRCPNCDLYTVIPYTADELAKYIEELQHAVRQNDQLKREIRKANRDKVTAHSNVIALQRHIVELEAKIAESTSMIIARSKPSTDTEEVKALRARIRELESQLRSNSIPVPDPRRRERSVGI